MAKRTLLPIQNTAAFDYHDGIIVQIVEREISGLGFTYDPTVYTPGFEISPLDINSRERRNMQEIADELHTEHADQVGSNPNWHIICVTYP